MTIRNSSAPTPDEMQSRLGGFCPPAFSLGKSGRARRRGHQGLGAGNLNPGDFEFKNKPRDVKAYLDRFVIKQDEAKKVLSVALCDHYHQVRLALEGQGIAQLRQAKYHPHRAHRRGQNLSDPQRRRT